MSTPSIIAAKLNHPIPGQLTTGLNGSDPNPSASRGTRTHLHLSIHQFITDHHHHHHQTTTSSGSSYDLYTVKSNLTPLQLTYHRFPHPSNYLFISSCEWTPTELGEMVTQKPASFRRHQNRTRHIKATDRLKAHTILAHSDWHRGICDSQAEEHLETPVVMTTEILW